MMYLVAMLLALCWFVGPAAAQSRLGGEEVELIRYPHEPGDSADINKLRCGDYFLSEDARVETARIALSMDDNKRRARIVLIIRKYDIEVIIDEAKSIPTGEIVAGPKILLRMNRADYDQAVRCLPPPRIP